MESTNKTLGRLKHTIEDVMEAGRKGTLIDVVEVKVDGRHMGYAVQPSPETNAILTKYRIENSKKTESRKKAKESIGISDSQPQIIEVKKVVSKLPKSEKKLGEVCTKIDNFSTRLEKDVKLFYQCDKQVKDNNSVIKYKIDELEKIIEESKKKHLDNKPAIAADVKPEIAKLNNLCSHTRQDVAFMEDLNKSADSRNTKLNELLFNLDELSKGKDKLREEIELNVENLKHNMKEAKEVFTGEGAETTSNYRGLKKSFDTITRNFDDFCASPSEAF